jgi:hypothetical protein
MTVNDVSTPLLALSSLSGAMDLRGLIRRYWALLVLVDHWLVHQRDHESDETSQGPSNGSDPVRVDETLLSCWIGLLQELIVQWHLDHGGADPDEQQEHDSKGR